MIGDSLSDSYANITEGITGYYREEWDSLPVHIRVRILSVLEDLNTMREEVDIYQITRKV